jgi:hypothetical protein
MQRPNNTLIEALEFMKRQNRSINLLMLWLYSIWPWYSKQQNKNKKQKIIPTILT